MNPLPILLMDAAYGSHPRQRFDLAVPPGYEKRGLILFIHGGSWTGGDKEYYRNALGEWAEKGFAAAAMNYRYLSRETHMDGLLGDISSALGAISDLADREGVRLEKVLLTGASAGAHLSLLYAYSRMESAPIRPACVVEFCGPVLMTDEKILCGTPDDPPPTEKWFRLFSDMTGVPFLPENKEEFMPLLRRYSPLIYVSERAVPTVICHGMKDTGVPFSQAKALRDRLEECGVEYAFLPMPRAGHSLTDQPEIVREAEVLMEFYARRFLDGEEDKRN